MKSSKTKTKPKSDFEPLALDKLPKDNSQFTDIGFKSKKKPKGVK